MTDDKIYRLVNPIKLQRTTKLQADERTAKRKKENKKKVGIQTRMRVWRRK